MPPITITVPARHQDRIRRGLLSLYGVKAEALYNTVDEYLLEREPLPTLVSHRDELAAVDGLLGLIGWELGARTGDVELAGEAQLVDEILTGALRDAAEALGELEPAPQLVEPAAVKASLRELEELVSLIEAARAS
jgi:hypothetical protein